MLINNSELTNIANNYIHNHGLSLAKQLETKLPLALKFISIIEKGRTSQCFFNKVDITCALWGDTDIWHHSKLSARKNSYFYGRIYTKLELLYYKDLFIPLNMPIANRHAAALAAIVEIGCNWSNDKYFFLPMFGYNSPFDIKL